MAEEAAALHPGDRCEVNPGGKRGVIRCAMSPTKLLMTSSPQQRAFWESTKLIQVVLLLRHVGRCQGLPKGFWVGVQYDEPVGKNNGTVKGVQYFDCLPSYGAVVRPDTVTAGDYPPLDDLFLDEDEI